MIALGSLAEVRRGLLGLGGEVGEGRVGEGVWRRRWWGKGMSVAGGSDWDGEAGDCFWLYV